MDSINDEPITYRSTDLESQPLQTFRSNISEVSVFSPHTNIQANKLDEVSAEWTYSAADQWNEQRETLSKWKQRRIKVPLAPIIRHPPSLPHTASFDDMSNPDDISSFGSSAPLCDEACKDPSLTTLQSQLMHNSSALCVLENDDTEAVYHPIPAADEGSPRQSSALFSMNSSMLPSADDSSDHNQR